MPDADFDELERRVVGAETSRALEETIRQRNPTLLRCWFINRVNRVNRGITININNRGNRGNTDNRGNVGLS